MKKRGIIFIILAPSGAGKSTLIKRIKKDFKELHWSVSFTTRKRREEEIDGKHYFFISKDEFIKKRDQGDYLEWAQVHGNLYGTSHSFVESKLKEGQSLLLDIDIQGANAVRKSFSLETITIFISPPNLQELEKRLRDRGTDDEKTIALRIKNATQEMDKKNDYDYLIINDDIDKAYKQLHKIVKNSMCKQELSTP